MTRRRGKYATQPPASKTDADVKEVEDDNQDNISSEEEVDHKSEKRKRVAAAKAFRKQLELNARNSTAPIVAPNLQKIITGSKLSAEEISNIEAEYELYYTSKFEKQKVQQEKRKQRRARRQCCPTWSLNPGQIVMLTFMAIFVWLWYLNAYDVIEEAGGITSFAAKTIPDEIQVRLSTLGINLTAVASDDPDRPSLPLVGKLKAHHPVIMIPGVVTTGLEIWGGQPCVAKNFRQRLWGHLSMMQQLVADRSCWLQHIMLNRSTGLDPEGVKLRAAGGLEAADYFLPGYWVWGKMIQNLADLGYDSNNLFMASYDWRLSVRRLEKRDRYFTKLKATIELAYEINKEKIVVLGHSMGTNVFLYFLSWVERPLDVFGGGGGQGWVNKHIHAFVNIAGPLLGVPKAVPSLLSGEMRDTAQLGPLNTYLIDAFFTKRQRSEMFRSWGSIPIMFPKGGNRIWGTETWSPDALEVGSYVTLSVLPNGVPDTSATTQTDKQAKELAVYSKFGNVTHIRDPTSYLYGRYIVNITADKVWDFIVEETLDAEWAAFYNTVYSHGLPPSKDVSSRLNNPKYWSNPLESVLPNAPNMTMYCFYGVGKEAERAYMYKTRSDVVEEGDVQVEIDYTISKPDIGLDSGVQSGEGDGTVPLLSLGYMCVEGWTNKQYPYNPAEIPVITREYQHNPTSIMSDLRGGPQTADHVDIMGNWEMTVDILKIVTGQVEQGGKRSPDEVSPEKDGVDVGDVIGKVESRILSQIREYASRISLFSE
eukprot:TRINITY_DN3236_c0_g1_i1.p1 TRINITY_DN3236_c0_g1~~TRINITY_DN3236_c0_g1_i1.p1  ORF type:complete len:763 (-),score=116.08 TRINITY_DN3236_c0_g1_i1:52-2340(-)